MKKILLTLLFTFFICNSLNAQTISDISFYTEEYPPYNFRGPDGKLQGMSIDMLQEILKTMNSKRSAQESDLTLWDTVYKKLLSGKNVLGFATTRSLTRENLFKWAGPIVFSRTIVLGLKGAKLSSLDDLKNFKVAVIKNDAGHHIAKEKGVPDENFILATTMDEILNAMKSKKADFWVYEESVAKWYLKSKGEINNFDVVENFGANNLSYAFSKDVSDEFVIEFQDALDEVKSSDVYFDILDRYTK